MDSIAVLCGGVGAARFLRGLVDVVPPQEVTAVVNVADDTVLHGLHVSPDIDTVIYTLAGAIDPDRGWGLVDETWHAMEQFARLGNPTWFNLGDRDLATHIVRTERLRAGHRLTEVTDHLARSWGLDVRIVPVTDDPVRTRVLVDGSELEFQEYFVGRQHAVPIEGVRFAGIEEATPQPTALAAIEQAATLVIAPSNPIVSIGPVLGVPGVRNAVAARRATTVAVSPIVGGAALKGPAAQMLTELGQEASVVGVARMYAPVAGTLIIDTADADLADAVEAEGVRCVVTETIMSDPARAAALAATVLETTR